MSSGTHRAEFHIGEIIAASWRVFAANFLILFLGHILFNVIVSVAGSVLPFIGSLLLAGPMWYGLCVIALAGVRGAPVKWDALFAGFQRFLPTCLVGAIMTLFGLACIIVLLVPAIAAIYLAWMTHNVVVFSLTFSVSLTMCLVPACAIIVLYAPSFFFIHDYKKGAWETMEASRTMVWGNLRQWLILWAGLSILQMAGIFLPLLGIVGIYCVLSFILSAISINFLTGIIFTIGLPLSVLGSFLLCIAGILITTPWMIVALAIAYEREQRLALPETPDAG